MIVVRYADDTIVGFQHQYDAERFLADLKERLAKFALSLHPDKTRLIEFGRFVADDRASGRRQAGNVRLPGVHAYLREAKRDGTASNCGGRRSEEPMGRRSRGLERNSARHTARADRRAGPMVGHRARGHYAYFAVPTNSRAASRHSPHMVKSVVSEPAATEPAAATDMAANERLVDRYLPQPRVLHPWPEQRFLVKHSGRSRMPELGKSGSVRGAVSNGRPYRDKLCCEIWVFSMKVAIVFFG